jgi:IS66 Orf2 like protein
MLAGQSFWSVISTVMRPLAGLFAQALDVVRQAYFGRRVTITRYLAGILSSRSERFSPMICRSPPQQGQLLACGSMTISSRGRCAVVPPTGVRVLIATKPVDFRKEMDGLAAYVEQELRADPFVGKPPSISRDGAGAWMMPASSLIVEHLAGRLRLN